LKNKGKLITLEGPDFSGKSTQFKQVMANFEDNNILYTREPGSFLPESMYYCEEIRNEILNNNWDPLREAELFAESRYEHTKEIVKYANEGYNILCDRYIVSSLAYQGFAQELGKDKIYELNKTSIDLLEKNNMSIYNFKFAISKDVWEERKKERLKKESADSIESKNIYDKIFEFYNNDKLFYDYTDKLNMFTHTINADESITDISKKILKLVNILAR
jgi:dTMP kinase